jgi:hypothetical protein
MPVLLTAPVQRVAEHCDNAEVTEIRNTKRAGEGEQTLTLSDPMSDLVRHYGFPVPDAFLDL